MIESRNATQEVKEKTSENSADSEKISVEQPLHAQAGPSISDLQKRISELEAQLKDKENRYLYLYADFDNFKKRASKERSDLVKFGWEPVAHDLLQVIDNLERALSHVPPETDKVLLEGLNMVLSQFKSTLKKQGIEHIEALRKEFDPNLHEAIGHEASELPSGTVVKELTPGYTLHGRLLRPARVIISGGR